MTTDKELLELAAKAADIEYTVQDDGYYKTHSFFGLWLVFHDEPSEYARRYWNPLTDDGDALRLAVKLGLVINCRHSQALVETMDKEFWERHDNGEDVAVRRAIVRAAAEIGKDVK